VIPKFILSVAVLSLLGLAALAQKSGDKTLSESDLLKQIESLTPPDPANAKSGSAPTGLFETGLGEDRPSGSGKKEKSGEKKSKGPTEITALEATFDQKANLAVFIGDVVVKDPEFNVTCDKLTAHLKHEDKAKAGGAAAPKTPTPPPDAAAPKKKGGGLEKAVAESTSERRVVITQDKQEADGSKTLSVGRADKATYDAVTGDIVLSGTPEVTQGINRVLATDPGTVMTLNRDGRMRANGATRTTIVDKVEAGL
jgi:lipopolysaccharide export system protein LptA